MPTKQQITNLVFSISKVGNKMRKDNYAKRISTTGAISMAAVLEYLVAELLEVAGDCATENDRVR